MVGSCIMCKKFQSKLKPYRSFHRFPIKEDSKNQWLIATGLTKVSRSTRICSDHFKITDFENLKSRKLYEHAVPDMNNVPTFFPGRTLTASVNGYSLRVEISENANQPLAKSKSKTSSNNENSRVCQACYMDSEDKKVIEVYGNMNTEGSVSNPESELRFNNSAILPNTRSGSVTVKRTQKKKLGRMTRADFLSDEAWNRYRKNHFCLQKQLKVLKRNFVKRDETKKKLFTLINDLKSTKYVKTDNYLK